MATASPGQSIDHCCGLLQKGKSDEERFVGLLLASKLVVAPADLRRVCDAALPFVRRLVNSPPPPDTEGGGNPYRGLALSVLAGFVTDAELLARTDLLSCAVAAGGSALGADSGVSEEEARDGAAVLEAALRQPAGLAEAVRTRLLSSVLARAAASGLDPPAPAGDAPPDEALAGPSRADLACSLLAVASASLCASAGTPLGEAIFSLSPPNAIRAELLAAAAPLARALAKSRDGATGSRLAALLAVLQAAEAASRSADAVPPLPPSSPLCEALRLGLGSLLSSRVQPAVRSDALRAASHACSLLGPLWVLGASPLRRPSALPPRAATGESIAPTAEATRHAAMAVGDGALLSLLVQLCTVELCMCLHDQPADDVSEHVLALLPACCSVLEEALFRLHADAAEEEEDEEAPYPSGSSSVGATCWVDALSDEQLLSAQRAFQSVAKAALDFVEAVRAEESASARAQPAAAGAPPHPLLPPVSRLLSAWMVQPSAFASMELYDRANAVLPTLQAASQGEADAWAREMRSFERVPAAAPHLPPGGTPPTDETMADLFAKMMGGAKGPEAETLLRELQKERAAF